MVEPCVAGRKRHDLGLGDRRHDVEVEVGQALAGQQLRLVQVALDTPAGTFRQFVLGEGGEEPRRRPALGIGAFAEAAPDILHCRQPEFRQQQIELECIDLVGGVIACLRHDAPPMPSSAP